MTNLFDKMEEYSQAEENNTRRIGKDPLPATPVTNKDEALSKKAEPATVVTEAVDTPHTGEYHDHRNDRRVYHVEGT